jgi:hypothetical protein
MKRFFITIAVSAILFSFSNFAFSQEFSSNVTTKTKEGTESGKVFVSKDKIRMEMETAISIARTDKKLVWMLLPQDKIYMEMPMGAENTITLMNKVPGEISRKLLGTETISGRETEKYEVVYQDKVKDKEQTINIWLSKDLQFPLKSSNVDGSWSVEYTDVKEGPQPAAMFELPADYKKFEYGATEAEAAGNR